MDRIEVSAEAKEAIHLLREVSGTLPQFRDCFPELPQSAADCFRVKDDHVLTAGTNELVITLEPTQRMLEFVAAVWARELASKPRSEI
jgi:hypothetical protein